MAPEEVKTMKPAQRAFRKIRTASLVSSLTKGWQQWASEHSTKQAQEPTGWVPTIDDNAQEPTKPKSEVQVKPTIVSVARKSDTICSTGLEDSGDTHIKTKIVTKTISSNIHEKGRDIASLTEKYEKDPGSETQDAMVDRLLKSNVSPTRRRKCSNLVSQLTKGWKQIEGDGEELDAVPGAIPKLGECRSDSLETEDSGYGDGEGDVKVLVDLEKENGSDSDSAWIKRSSSSLNNKGAVDLHNINKAYKRYSPVGNIKGKWEKWSGEHVLSQKLNPFSDEFDHEFAMSTRLHKGDKGYGRPKEGTKTAERAARAEAHIYREMKDLCFIIGTMARPGKDGKVRVTFGELFDRYVRISDKVVGILIRARKHDMVDFYGEMLWQGKDDHVIITLL
ncbi:actin-binding Rho-activating protein [Discoglossus pictus]